MEEGALVAFNSAVDAVECAISLQEELARDQEELPSGERIVLRIGINLADVVIEGDDLLGDGVYVAARLEASAEPGGICIADAVHRQLGGKCRTAFLGRRRDIPQEYRQTRSRLAFRYTPIAAPSMSSASARTLIAVLPFENLCSSPDQTFFSDGITEDIIGGLQFSCRGSGRSTLADSQQVVPLRPKRRPLRPPVVRLVSRRLAPGSRRPA